MPSRLRVVAALPVIGLLLLTHGVSILRAGRGPGSWAIQQLRGESEMDEMLLELVEAERGFARAAEQHGLREAFLTYLADSSTVFLPAPAPGRASYEMMEPTSALLSWWPAYAELSREGELGFTTGPWELRIDRHSAEPSRAGQYLSFWRRESDGRWKVVVDIGIKHEPMASPVPSFCRGRRASGTSSAQGDAVVPQDPEVAFRERAAKSGYGSAVLRFASPEIRVLRSGRGPLLGRSEAHSLLAAEERRISSPIAQERRIFADDLGAVFGAQSLVDVGASSRRDYGFLRAWRREASEWHLIADVLVPLPTPDEH